MVVGGWSVYTSIFNGLIGLRLADDDEYAPFQSIWQYIMMMLVTSVQMNQTMDVRLH
jgi:hypothetical protein